jgi:hypothetical protein
MTNNLDDKSTQDLFKGGLDVCQKIECDYTGFDPVFQLCVCRWRERDDEKPFSHEFTFPIQFYMATKVHWGGDINHDAHLKKTDEYNKQVAEQSAMLSNGIANHSRLPVSGGDAQ